MELALQRTAEIMRLLRAACHPQWRTCRIAIRDPRKSLPRIRPTVRRESELAQASQRGPGSRGRDGRGSLLTPVADLLRLRLAMDVEARVRFEFLLGLRT